MISDTLSECVESMKYYIVKFPDCYTEDGLYELKQLMFLIDHTRKQLDGMKEPLVNASLLRNIADKLDNKTSR